MIQTWILCLFPLNTSPNYYPNTRLDNEVQLNFYI